MLQSPLGSPLKAALQRPTAFRATTAAPASPTIILTRGNGADGSTTFTNEAPGKTQPVAFGGTPVNTTSQTFLGRAVMNMTGGALRYPTQTLTAPWTIEYIGALNWYYVTMICFGRKSTATGFALVRELSKFQLIKIDGAGDTVLNYLDLDDFNAGTATPQKHAALCMDASGNMYAAYDGAVAFTVTAAAAGIPTTLTNDFVLGDRMNTDGSAQGNNRDIFAATLRVTLGQARYMTTYTPPTSTELALL